MKLVKISSAVLAIVVIALGSIVAFEYITGLPEPDASKSAAAIQAIGSVMAILIAVAIPAWLHVKSEESKQEERRIFAAAFSTQLLPHLSSLKDGLAYIAEDLDRAIKNVADPEVGVTWNDHGPDFHGHFQFIRDNWSAIALLDGVTARAVVSAASVYARALEENIDVEHGVETMGNGEGSTWHTISFGSLAHARGYLEGARGALRHVSLAIAKLQSSSGEK